MPSHIGIPLNEKADKEANQIALKATIDHETIPKSDMKAHIKQAVKHKWRDKWRNTTSNKYREITDSINFRPASTYNMKQVEESMIRYRPKKAQNSGRMMHQRSFNTIPTVYK